MGKEAVLDRQNYLQNLSSKAATFADEAQLNSKRGTLSLQTTHVKFVNSPC